VAKDKQEAQKWYEKAAANGYVEARDALKRLKAG
jgi:TPR repeat protein